MKAFRTLILLFLFTCLGLSNALAKGIDHDYAAWNALSKKHVKWLPDNVQSRVNYAGFKQDKAALSAVLADFSAVSQAEFDQFSSEQQAAFLINAYNAFTIDLILSKYPDLKSIKDLGSFVQSPWKKKFFTLLGAERSLDWIEHENLRTKFKDPRIHVAIVCASIGCPALRNEAITASKLDAQLEDSMQRFMSDKSRNRLADGKLEVSPIFKWFAEDFEKGNKGFKSTQDVFARYARQLSADPVAQEKIKGKSLSVSFSNYDWNLNDSARP
ncbi:MAG: hypothetical protein RL748_2725 [Pseudomonadota bacterium]